MNWLALSLNEWRRRPLRTGITATGVAIAVAAMFSLLACHDGYRDGMRSEIDRLGAHVLVVPKGCPYDAASIALHGANWPCYLNSGYLAEVSGTPGVASAAPAFMAALPGTNGSQIVYVGINERMLALKPGWRIDGAFPRGGGEVLAGAEAARLHGWKTGDRVLLPELAEQRATVAGILQPTHGADDSFIYTRLLLGCVALIGMLVAATGVSNAVLMSVAERSREIGIMRALGASRAQVFKLIFLETLQVCIAGGLAGVLLAFAASHGVESWLRSRLPFAPGDALIRWEWWIAAVCVGGAMVLGGFAALLPASRAAELSPVEAMREGAKV